MPSSRSSELLTWNLFYPGIIHYQQPSWRVLQLHYCPHKCMEDFYLFLNSCPDFFPILRFLQFSYLRMSMPISSLEMAQKPRLPSLNAEVLNDLTRLVKLSTPNHMKFQSQPHKEAYIEWGQYIRTTSLMFLKH